MYCGDFIYLYLYYMLSKEALILQNRSAFVAYLTKGMEAVQQFYPESVEFVKQHSDKSLLVVTEILTKQLNELNK